MRAKKISWFPGHMRRGIEQLEARLKEIDLFLEIRDARLPFSTFNKKVDDIIKTHKKTKIVLFNKWDLCDTKLSLKVVDELQMLGITCIRTSSTQRAYDFQQILKVCNALVSQKHSTVGLWLMVGGMPNVGKSSVINSLRVLAKEFHTNQVTKSTARPCQTTHVTGFKVFNNPLVYVVDTPGILLPSMENAEMAFNLGILGIIPLKILGAQNVVSHLFKKLAPSHLDSMFKNYTFSCRPNCGEDIVFLTMEAFKIKEPDVACDKILTDFRNGDFGKITLDSIHTRLKS